MLNIPSILVIALVAVSGILFYTCLEKIPKAPMKFFKILYIIIAVILLALCMQGILELCVDNMGPDSYLMRSVLIFLMRIIQFLILGIGGLISLCFAFERKPKLQS